MWRRRGGPIAGVLALALVLGACAGEGSAGRDESADDAVHGSHRGEVQYQPASMGQAGETDAVVVAARDLGMAMVGSGQPGQNLITSPASAVFALAMVTEGADGQTLSELASVLGAQGQDRTDAMSALQASLGAYGGDPAEATSGTEPPTPIAHVANNVVLDDQADLHPAFLDILTGAYDAGVDVTDLGSQAGKDVLDAWVLEHTGGLIEASSVEPDPDLVLVLQNAVLFAAQWDTPFPEYHTADRTFTLHDGTQVDLPTMSRTGQMAYAEFEGWQAVRLPYTEGFHAEVLLPPEGAPAHTIDAATFSELNRALDEAPREIELYLPQVEVESTLELGPVLADSGVVDAFDGARADFSGISRTPVVISQVTQQAVLRLGETGTVAAAVTEVGIETTSAEPVAPPPVIRVNRPFLFRLSHTETGLDLFLAAIADPRG